MPRRRAALPQYEDDGWECREIEYPAATPPPYGDLVFALGLLFFGTSFFLLFWWPILWQERQIARREKRGVQ